MASTVTITDAVNMWLDSKIRPQSRQGYYWTAVGFAVVNLILQAYLLYVALKSLLTSKDVNPGIIVTFLLVAGLLDVLALVLINVVLRYSLRSAG